MMLREGPDGDGEHPGQWPNGNGGEPSAWRAPARRQRRTASAARGGGEWELMVDDIQFSGVFLSPSHRYYTPKCALKQATVYSTPIGDLRVDHEVTEELKATGKFELMDLSVDEAEHGFEMLLPYLSKAFQGHNVKVDPVLIGSLDSDNEGIYGQLLAKYFDDPKNFFVVFTDFCHWGSKYKYIYYEEGQGAIHQFIEALDRMGMDIIESADPSAFTQYMQKYNNTICGCHPISVFLHMLNHCSVKLKVNFIRYDQSSQCIGMEDSSVSYACRIVVKVNPSGERRRMSDQPVLNLLSVLPLAIFGSALKKKWAAGKCTATASASELSPVMDTAPIAIATHLSPEDQTHLSTRKP
ncbi:hypothetical protein PR202_gb08388 [Eleusine coracana subsp. coracana]|uniref:Protein MEMO1 n=1 Tax=Eleusine coracana subsp. coracana TaxID=191504 RepID=A0AAV5EEG7_ELECO|nr:hypothetical protein PR202_gb08388 [Eleusine coracana subsp. coracana]